MFKYSFLTILAFGIMMPVFADEINVNSMSNFSGYYNKSARSVYPQLKKSLSATEVINEQNENAYQAKSVKEYAQDDRIDRKGPMTYSQFPQNYDSSNMLYIQQNRNMLMGF